MPIKSKPYLQTHEGFLKHGLTCQNVLVGPGRLQKSPIDAQLLMHTIARKTPKLEFWTNSILLC